MSVAQSREFPPQVSAIVKPIDSSGSRLLVLPEQVPRSLLAPLRHIEGTTRPRRMLLILCAFRLFPAAAGRIPCGIQHTQLNHLSANVDHATIRNPQGARRADNRIAELQLRQASQ